MKILISGSTGFIGKALVEKIAAREDITTIYCLSKKRKNDLISNKIININKNINNYIEEVLLCDIIINCAGEKNNENEMHKTNVDGAINLLHLANLGVAKSFIHLSSVGSYGAERFAGKITEDTVSNPKNKYEITKFKAEIELLNTIKRDDLRLLILQPSNIIDVSKDKSQVLPNLIKLCKFGYGIKLNKKDGWLNFISLEYVVSNIEKLINEPLHKNRLILNCPIKYSEAILLISKFMGVNLKFIIFSHHIEKTVNFILNFVNIKKLKQIQNQLFEMNNDRYFETKYLEFKFSRQEIEKLYFDISTQKD